MPWNSTWPVGNISVKANRVVGQQNTTYIETTMGNSVAGTNTNTTRDHFWNVGSNEDGRHRWVQSPALVSGVNPADATLGVGMDAALYAKTTNGRVEWFHRNAAGIYQAVPSFLTGTVNIPSSSNYNNIVAVPANVYGEIYMYNTTPFEEDSSQWGFFFSDGSRVQAWAVGYKTQGSGQYQTAIKLGNGAEGVGLQIRARRDAAGSGKTSWNYRITYRAL